MLLHFEIVNTGAKRDCCQLGNKINGMLSHSKGKQKAAVRLKIRPQKSEQHGDSSWEKPLLSLHRSIGISGPATQSAWLQLGEPNLGIMQRAFIQGH